MSSFSTLSPGLIFLAPLLDRGKRRDRNFRVPIQLVDVVPSRPPILQRRTMPDMLERE